LLHCLCFIFDKILGKLVEPLAQTGLFIVDALKLTKHFLLLQLVDFCKVLGVVGQL